MLQWFLCPEMWSHGFLSKSIPHKGNLLEFKLAFFICENNHNGIKCNKVMLLVGETAYCFWVNYDNFY